MDLSQVSWISLRGDGSADKNTIAALVEDPGLFTHTVINNHSVSGDLGSSSELCVQQAWICILTYTQKNTHIQR